MGTELVTIVCEAVLEKVVTLALDDLGVTGYTILDARGKGSTGSRSGDWGDNSNIQIQVLCDTKLASTICENFQQEYFEHYAMILYRSAVSVLRSSKFQGE